MSMNFDFLFWLAGGIIAVLTAWKLLFTPVMREMREFTAWWRKFQRDWDGEPAEPGRSAVPGVMQRLNNIDGQLHRNGGESLKDKVCDTWELAKTLSDRVETIESRQREIRDEQRVLAVKLQHVDADIKHVGGHA